MSQIKFDSAARLAHLRRIITYAGTFVGLMAGRWVAGMAAAALSVNGIATALVFLRGAIIRTGIGALSDDAIDLAKDVAIFAADAINRAAG